MPSKMSSDFWTTITVTPTTGTWVHIWQDVDGSTFTETAPAILVQEINLDGERETRVQFSSQTHQVAGTIAAVAEVMDENPGLTCRYTVPADQVAEKLAAIASEAVGGNGQHERAIAALGQVRRAATQGRAPESVDVSTALACACEACLNGNAELAAELDKLGVL